MNPAGFLYEQRAFIYALVVVAAETGLVYCGCVGSREQ